MTGKHFALTLTLTVSSKVQASFLSDLELGGLAETETCLLGVGEADSSKQGTPGGSFVEILLKNLHQNPDFSQNGRY